PLGLGDPQRAVDQVADRGGIVRLLAERGGHVAVELQQLDLLLEVTTDRPHERLPHDRDDGLVVELGVVEPVQQVDRARSGGRHADTDLARELRVPAGHERGHLLVAGLDEAQLVLVATQRAEDAIDAIPREAVDGADVPFDQPLTKIVRCGLAHALAFRGSVSPPATLRRGFEWATARGCLLLQRRMSRASYPSTRRAAGLLSGRLAKGSGKPVEARHAFAARGA